MLEVPESLKSKVEEAVTVLRDHQIKEQEQQVSHTPALPPNQQVTVSPSSTLGHWTSYTSLCPPGPN